MVIALPMEHVSSPQGEGDTTDRPGVSKTGGINSLMLQTSQNSNQTSSASHGLAL